MLSEADKKSLESKIPTNDRCEKGSQERYLDSSKEKLEDNTLSDDTQTIDLANTKEKFGDNIEGIATATNLIPQNEDSTTTTNLGDTQLTAQNENSTTKTDLIAQNNNTTTATNLTIQTEDISLQETSKENAPLNDLAEKVSKERELDKRVMDILLAIGISANLHGYYFLKDSIKLAISSPVFIGAITKTMYPTIATMHQTTAFRVERAMRHAIDVSYNKGKIPCLNQIFSLDIFSPYDKPTNAEFIALIADKLKQEFCY